MGAAGGLRRRNLGALGLDLGVDSDPGDIEAVITLLDGALRDELERGEHRQTLQQTAKYVN
jgi:hypothetical protein